MSEPTTTTVSTGLVDAMVRALIAQDAPLLTDLPEPPRDWTVTTDDDEVLYV
jgi:hypothetical protein